MVRRHMAFLAWSLLPALALAAEWHGALDGAPTWYGWNSASPYYSPLLPQTLRSLRGDLDLSFREGGWNARGALRLSETRGQAAQQKGVLQQAYYDGDLGQGRGFTLGKKVLSWGVGYGFRPLDVVQREDRRAANPPPLEGLPLVAWERFGEQETWSLVWVRPGAGGGGGATSDNRASALALYGYRLVAGTDWHGVARLSRRHGLELGAGLAWTRGEEWAFHGAALYETRHRPRAHALVETNGLLAASDPLHEVPGGAAWRAVAGGQWIGASGWSVLAEAWYDGEAWRRADWSRLDALTRQQRGLTGFAPQAAIEGNIAWSGRAFDAPNLLRENLMLRLAWEEPQRWRLSLECLAAPRDGGRVTSAAATWTGDRQSLSGGLRVFGGRADSAYAQAPLARLAWLEWRLGFR